MIFNESNISLAETDTGYYKTLKFYEYTTELDFKLCTFFKIH